MLTDMGGVTEREAWSDRYLVQQGDTKHLTANQSGICNVSKEKMRAGSTGQMQWDEGVRGGGGGIPNAVKCDVCAIGALST